MLTHWPWPQQRCGQSWFVTATRPSLWQSSGGGDGGADGGDGGGGERGGGGDGGGAPGGAGQWQPQPAAAGRAAGARRAAFLVVARAGCGGVLDEPARRGVPDGERARRREGEDESEANARIFLVHSPFMDRSVLARPSPLRHPQPIVRPAPLVHSLQRHSADATTYFTSDASKASVIAVAP